MDARALEIKMAGKTPKTLRWRRESRMLIIAERESNYQAVLALLKTSHLTSLIFIEPSDGELIGNALFLLEDCCVLTHKLRYITFSAFFSLPAESSQHRARAGTLWDCAHLITYPRCLLVHHYSHRHTHLAFNHVHTAGD